MRGASLMHYPLRCRFVYVWVERQRCRSHEHGAHWGVIQRVVRWLQSMNGVIFGDLMHSRWAAGLLAAAPKILAIGLREYRVEDICNCFVIHFVFVEDFWFELDWSFLQLEESKLEWLALHIIIYACNLLSVLEKPYVKSEVKSADIVLPIEEVAECTLEAVSTLKVKNHQIKNSSISSAIRSNSS